LEEREPLEKKGIPQSIKESFRTGDVRMRVGIILILCILGGIVSFYLLIDKPSPTISQVDVRSSPSLGPQPSPPPPSIKIDLPKEATPPPKTVPPQQKPSPPSPEKPKTASIPEKETKEVTPPPQTVPPQQKSSPPSPEKPKTASIPEKETESKIPEKTVKEARLPEKREASSFSYLVDQGPALLKENKYLKLLEDINQLPENERQNINIKILESFVYLKKWVLLKDKNSKTLWSNLYNTLEHSGDRSATPILMKIAKDPEEWTRLYAVNLLGSIGDRRALNDLQEIASKDPNRRIRRNASNAISLIQKRG
jgi:hypothetical protein